MAVRDIFKKKKAIERGIFVNRIKDFIYDKNDLLVALVIVLLAAFIIVLRVDVIMAYPATIEAEMDNAAGDKVAQKPPEGDTADPDDEDEAPDDSDADGESGNPDGDGETNNQGQNGSDEGKVSIYIDYGSTASHIAQLLVDAGLIENKEIFYDALSSTGADTRLQAGSFSIPANSSTEEIIRIITH